jgi:hypothetical protein
MRREMLAAAMAVGFTFGASAVAAAADYQIAVASRPPALATNRTGVYSFTIRLDPASSLQRLDGNGMLCVSHSQFWEWTAPVVIPPISRGETKTVNATIKAKGDWTGTKPVIFTAASPASTCSASGIAPSGQSNRIEENLGTAPTLVAPIGVAPPNYEFDLIEVESITFTPQVPLSGQPVSIKMTGRYKGGQPLPQLQLRIRRGNQVIGQTVRQNVAPRSTFEFTAQWPAVHGAYGFLAEADVDNLAGEGPSALPNNRKNGTVIVEAAPANPSTPPATGGSPATDVPDIVAVRAVPNPLGWVGYVLVCNARSSAMYQTRRDNTPYYSGGPSDFFPGNFIPHDPRCPSGAANKASFEIRFPIDKWPVETCWVSHTFTVTGAGGSDSFTYRTEGRDRCRGPRPGFNR